MNYLKRNIIKKKIIQNTLTKITIILFVSFAFTGSITAQEKVEASDIKILHNTKWMGSLMYIDCSSGKETYLKTEMQLEVKANKIVMSTQYNDEPKANSKGAIKLKKGGTYFGKEKIIEKTMQENGVLKIVTLFDGRDNNKQATIYKTYLFNDKIYTVIKEVQLKGSKEKFIRNKYSYTRI